MEHLKILVIGILIFTFWGIMSCGNADNSRKNGEKIMEQDTTMMQVQFPFPVIPEVLTIPEDRKAYLLTHYWEQFDFTDTTLVNNRDVTEQGFVNFIALLEDGTTPEELTRESLERWCAGFVGKDHAQQVLTKMADDYLFNPDSPFYNERLYEMYLDVMLNTLPQENAMQSYFRFKLELVRRNNVGKKATDFIYYLADGTRHTLVTTPVKSNRLLLMFYDPECKSCHEVLLQMATDTTLTKVVHANKLSVLAIYTEGNDEIWRKSLPDMPEGWIVGTDREAVKIGALYDLKAMPSLYLLDGKTQVVLKDASYEKIRQELK